MSKHIAVLGIAAALLGAAALPDAAAAADLYGYGGDERPFAFHGRYDEYDDGGRARVERRGDVAPEGYGYRHGPGPVVFDKRHADEGWGYGGPVRRPAYHYGDDRSAVFVPRGGDPYGYGEGLRGDPGFRPAAAYRAGLPAGPDFGGPEGGCTVEQARSVTPAGWQKIVTHRTCYRR